MFTWMEDLLKQILSDTWMFPEHTVAFMKTNNNKSMCVQIVYFHKFKLSVKSYRKYIFSMHIKAVMSKAFFWHFHCFSLTVAVTFLPHLFYPFLVIICSFSCAWLSSCPVISLFCVLCIKNTKLSHRVLFNSAFLEITGFGYLWLDKLSLPPVGIRL